jgi:hypothetical protein
VATAKFRLGRIVATPGALTALGNSGQDPAHFIALHAWGAWGEIDRDDREANDQAIANEGDPDKQARVLSAYDTTVGTRIWIITERDRSVTTILLPDEY